MRQFSILATFALVPFALFSWAAMTTGEPAAWVLVNQLNWPETGGKPSKPEWIYLENNQIRVGFSATHGGALGWISRKTPGSTIFTEENLVNIHDPGRWVQGAFYSGPQPFGKCHPGWPKWPWNPVQAGDAYGFVSPVLATRMENGKYYGKTIPLQWALENTPSEGELESWAHLVGNTILLKQRLTTMRKDQSIYPGRDQELPALYGVARLSRLVSGPDSDQPDGPIREWKAPPQSPPPPQWKTIRSPEGWAALVDEKGEGLGLVQPGIVRFLGGHYGEPGKGKSEDDSTGYVAAVRRETIDFQGFLEYEARIVVGSIEEVREVAKAHSPKNPWVWKPGVTRDHGNPLGLKDSPNDSGGRNLVTLNSDPQWVISDLAIPRNAVRSVVVRAKYPANTINPGDRTWKSMVLLDWDEMGEGRKPLILHQTIKRDGQWHDLTFDLAQTGNQKGIIRSIRWDPIEDSPQGVIIQLESIETRK